MSNLPQGAIVEVLGIVNGHGVKGVHIGKLPEAITAIITQRITEHKLSVEVAITGDKDTALQSLILDPQVPSINVAKELCKSFYTQYKILK